MGVNIYWVIETQNDTTNLVYRYADNDDGATSPAIDRALEKFHTVMAYRAEGRDCTMCAILDITGGVVKKERWVRAEVTPVAE